MDEFIEEIPGPSDSPAVTKGVQETPLAEYQDDGSGMAEDQQKMLLLTQNARQRIIEKLMGENLDKVPESTREQILLTSTLDGMDRLVLARARLKSDNKAANNMAVLAAEILKKINVNTPPPLPLEGESRKVPELPPEASDIELVPGEMDTGVKELTYETFMKQGNK